MVINYFMAIQFCKYLILDNIPSRAKYPLAGGKDMETCWAVSHLNTSVKPIMLSEYCLKLA
jgi:hypothetical protein